MRPSAFETRGERLGVVLMTYGSPAGPDDMPRYLSAVRGGRPVAGEVVAEFRRRYELIGGSPLVPITRAQAAAVEDALTGSGRDAKVVAGMRFSEPSIDRAVAELRDAGCDRMVGVVMSPQYSEMLMRGYRSALTGAGERSGFGRGTIALAEPWFRHPGFVAAVANRIAEGLSRLPAAVRYDAPVLLTAHSLPRSVAEREPGYLEQLRRTAELVADAADLDADRWSFCWQSAGHEPGEWMTPDFSDILPELRAAGHSAVLVAPIQFLADHLEVLYDIDIGAREQAEAAGMAFARIQSLNVAPQFVAALAAIAVDADRAARHGSRGRSAVEAE